MILNYTVLNLAVGLIRHIIDLKATSASRLVANSEMRGVSSV